MKRCPGCNAEKTEEEFYRSSSGRLSYYCKPCAVARAVGARRRRRAEDPEFRKRDRDRTNAFHAARMARDPDYAARMRAATAERWERYRERRRANGPVLEPPTSPPQIRRLGRDRRKRLWVAVCDGSGAIEDLHLTDRGTADAVARAWRSVGFAVACPLHPQTAVWDGPARVPLGPIDPPGPVEIILEARRVD